MFWEKLAESLEKGWSVIRSASLEKEWSVISSAPFGFVLFLVIATTVVIGRLHLHGTKEKSMPCARL